MPNERLTLQIDTITTGQAQVEALSASLNKVVSIAEAAQSKLNAAPSPAGYENYARRVGDSFGHTVPQVAAASAAVRVFEGTLSVRAVERFLTSVLQLGPALQAAFPVIGALAFADVLVKAGEKAVELYKKIDPIAQAQKRAADTTKALAGEIQNLGKEIQKFDLDRFEKVFGAAAGGAHRADAITQRDIQRDQNEITMLRGQIVRQQSVITRAGSLSPDALAARATLSAVTGIPMFGGGGISGGTASRAAIDIGTLNTQLSHSLEKLQADQNSVSTLLEPSAQARQDQIDSDKQTAQQAAETRQKQVDEYSKRGRLAAMSPIERIYAGMGDFSGLSASQHAAVQGSANIQASAELARIQEGQANLPLTLTGLNSSSRYVNRGDRGQAEAAKDLDEVLQRHAKDILETLKQANAELKQRDSAQISGIHSLSEHQARLSGIQNGSGPDEAQHELDIRTKALDMERQIVEAHSNLYDMDVERFRLDKEAQDGQFQYEEKIAEYRKQALQDAQHDQETFSHLIVEGFDALTSRNRAGATRSFVTGIGRNLADTVVGNAAGMLFNSHATQGILGSLHTGGTLGNLLKGTPFGPGGQNPVMSANTTATAANTAATNALTGALARLRGSAMSPSSGGGGFYAGGGGGLGTDIFGNTVPDIGAGSDGGIMSTNAIPDSWTQLPGIGSSSGGGSGFGFNASTIGKAAGAGIGALMAYQGFKKGGASGALQGTSAIMGTAALFDPEPISKAVLAIGAAVTGLVSGFLNGPQQRANQINTELSQNAYLAPTALNVTQGMNGTYQDFDARGNLRTSGMSAVPTVAQPYITSRRLNWGDPRTYYNAPGYVQSPYSGSAPGTGTAPVGNGGPQTVIIHAMDSQSFSDFAQKNHAAIGGAVTAHLQTNGGGALANAVAYHLGR